MRKRPSPQVEIISIGEELLGDHPGGNAEFLSRRLAALGFDVRFKSIGGDRPTETAALFRTAAARVDLVLATGGLGPTADDRTVEAVSIAFSVRWDFSPPLYDRLRRRFGARRQGLRRQCRAPGGFRPVSNRVGTAPGWIGRPGGVVVVLLPGVPAEMRAMFDRSIAAGLRSRFNLRPPAPTSTVRVVGLSEPRVDRAARRALAGEGRGIPTVLAGDGVVEVRFGPGASGRRAASRLRRAIGTAVFGGGDDSLEAVVAALLIGRRATVAVAESCSGGMLGCWLAGVPGASGWYRGGIIAYQPEIKRTMLGLSESTLRRAGVVSRQVAGAMAVAVRRHLQADYGLAITGEAGPRPTPGGQPVGTCCVGLAWSGGHRAVRHHFSGRRDQIRRRACVAALDMLRNHLVPGRGR